MNRQQFNSRNDIGQVLTFQKSGSTTSFNPSITFATGSRRVSWKLNNGVSITQIAGNNLSYSGFSSDTGIRDVEARVCNFDNVSNLTLSNCRLFGTLDLRVLKSWGTAFPSIILNNNLRLTKILNPNVNETFSNYQASSCNLTGNLDLTPMSGSIGSFIVNGNSNLTGITNSVNLKVIGQYAVNSCNLTGNLNLPFTGLANAFQVTINPLLTGITHASSSANIIVYSVNNNNLIGNLDLTPLSGLGGDFQAQSNPNLTSITHTKSLVNFTNYNVTSCNITGSHNLSMFPNLGGTLQFNINPNLTGITHTASTQNITLYTAQNCNLTGNHNLSWFPNLGGAVAITNNSNLTSITHTASTKNFTQYNLHQCNLTGTHDISMLSNLGGASTASTCYVTFYINPNLTDIIFPSTSGYFRNFANSENQSALGLYSCDLNYVNFKPLSGATFLTGATQGNPRINLRDNGMTAADVNQILTDFSGNATYNPTGWSNVNLNIGGTNSDPDSSSGGYDGLAAISFLTGSPYNWTITY